jgi:5-hydroxyisourate hydrolase-like protein (transthyretin family)
VVPTTSTLGNSPSAATYGGTVSVYGTATQAGTSTRLAGTTVTVQGRYAGSSTWFTAGTVKTTSTGAWKVTHKPYRNLQYRVLVPAVPGRWAGAGSRVGSSSVAPKVGAAFRAGTIRLSQTASVSTTVAPGRKYTVELQRRDGGKWVVVQRKATNSKGAVTLTVRPTKRGKYTYRVVTRADSYNRAGASSSRTLTVR